MFRFAQHDRQRSGGADRYITFLPAGLADSAAMAQEAAWELVESASVVTESLALASLQRIVFTAATCRKFDKRERSRR